MRIKPEDYINGLVGQLGYPYGAEQSIKLTGTHILSNRLLLSIHRDNLGAKPDKTLAGMLRKMKFPDKHLDRICAGLDAADILHFGYEGHDGGYTYKCYLEYAEQFRNSRLMQTGDEHLVHLAFKWNPESNADARISYYYSQPVASADEIKNCLTEVYGDCRSSVACAMTRAILSTQPVQKLGDELMLMFVTEENNDRMSFDINLYNAELNLAGIAVQLQSIAEYFNVDGEEWQGISSRNAGLLLGHLAGGKDGKGQEFYTVYFGVEERLPG